MTLAQVLQGAAIALVAGLVLGFGAGWRVQGWRMDAALADIERKQQAAEDARAEKADTAAESHAKNSEAIRTEVQTVIREVPRVVEKPVYRNVCLDADGLRLIRQALGDRAAGEPAPAVSGAVGAR